MEVSKIWVTLQEREAYHSSHSLLFCMFMASFSPLIVIAYIFKYNLFTLCIANCVYFVRVDCLTLENQLVCSIMSEARSPTPTISLFYPILLLTRSLAYLSYMLREKVTLMVLFCFFFFKSFIDFLNFT